MLYLLIIFILLFIVLVNPNKHILLKSLIFGLLFGIIAYNFIPRSDYDLARHHLFIQSFIRNDNFNFLIYKINLHEFELLPTIYSYLIARLNNINLSQFFVVTLGYGTIYYLVADYANKIKLQKVYYIPILLFAIFGFNILYFISGLYFYIGVIIFSLAVYLDYQKKINKIPIYILYLCTLLIHDSMLFPLALLLLFKIFRNKINVFSIIIISLSIYFSYSILTYLSTQDIFSFLSPIVKLYDAYLKNGENMYRLYHGNLFITEFLKLITVLLFTVISYKQNKENKIYNFIFLISFSTLFMLTKSIVMIRFCMLVQLMGIVPLSNYFKNSKNIKAKSIMFLYLVIVSSYYLLYFINIINNQTFAF